MSKNTVERGFDSLVSYVRRNRYNSSFTANTLRTKLAEAGVKPEQMGGLISRAIRSGLINRIGTTTSNDPTHKKGSVGVYTRTWSSYV